MTIMTDLLIVPVISGISYEYHLLKIKHYLRHLRRVAPDAAQRG